MPDSINTINVGGIDKEIEDTVARASGSSATSRCTVLESGLSNLTARVDEMATLPEGSTTGDAELMDIRVGADNIVHTNAGTAVRSQVNQLNAMIKDSAENAANLTPINLVKNRYIDTSGATVNISAVITLANYGYSITDCTEGDIFYIYGTGGAKPRLFCFIDGSGNVLYRAQPLLVRNRGIVVAPQNAAKIIIQDTTGNYPISYKGENIYSDLYSESTKYDFVESILWFEYINKYFNTQNSPVDINNPISVSGISSSVIDCQVGDKFRVSVGGGIAYSAWCFIDKDNNIISKGEPNRDYFDAILAVPPGAAKLILHKNAYNIVNNSTKDAVAFVRPCYRYLTETDINDKYYVQSGCSIIKMINGYYIDCSNAVIGSVLDLTPTRYYTSSEGGGNTQFAILDCEEGDLFSIYGVNGNKARLYCFVDENNVVIDVFNKTDKNSYYVIVKAPAGVKKVIINRNLVHHNSVTQEQIPCYRGYHMSSRSRYGNLTAKMTLYGHTLLYPDGTFVYNKDWYTYRYISFTGEIKIYVNTRTVIGVFTHTQSPTMYKRIVVREAGIVTVGDPEGELSYLSFSCQYKNCPYDEFIATYADEYFVSPAAAYSSLKVNSYLNSRPSSYGIANIKARLKQFADVKWTTVAPMPYIKNGRRDVIPTGTEVTGLPYSSTRSVDKYIGNNLSLYTFMSAVNNPRSVLYKRIITTGTLGATYYGVVCDSYVSYACGVKGAYKNINNLHPLCEKISPYAVEPGCILMYGDDYEIQSSAHALVINDVYKDEFGRIDTLDTTEAAPSFVHHNGFMEFETFINSTCKTYDVYKFKEADGVGYEASPFVKGYPTEKLEDVVFPDIMPEYGDKACVEAGTNVVINVVNPKAYNLIQVYKDNELIDQRNSMADFTISNIAYGTYRFVITDGTNTSESYLIAADVHGSYDPNTHVVTFSSANATPINVESYCTEDSRPGYGGVQNRLHDLTAAEIASGEFDATNLISTHFPCIKVFFMTEYGTAVWYSTPLDDQWEYWTPPTV